MLAYAIFVTFVLGALMGACAVILISVHMEKKEAAELFKSLRDELDADPVRRDTILNYDNV